MVMILYKMDISPPSRAVMIVIEILKLRVKMIDVDLWKREHFRDEFIKINPQHTVPTLIDDGFVVVDSHVIIPYLLAKYGKDVALFPTNLKTRTLVEQRLYFDAGVIFPAIRHPVVAIIVKGERSISPESLKNIKAAYELADKIIIGPWMIGDQFTIADICCATTITTVHEIIPIDENIYPNLFAWQNRCSKLDIFKKINAPGCKELKDHIQSLLA